MTGGVELEHTHRIAGAAVATMTAALFVFMLRARARRGRAWVVAACALVLAQASLGGLTVILRLPPAISIAHLATSMMFLSVLLVAAVRLAPPLAAPVARGAAPWLGVATAAVFTQIVLGGIVRHQGAALACTDVPLCSGALWPATALAQLHMAHRAMGMFAWATSVAATVALWRRTAPPWRGLAAVPALIATLQVALGVATVLAYAPLDLVTFHHVTGALLLASLVIGIARSTAPQPIERSQPDLARDAPWCAQP
jgi:cytochrome c oxidase assembly protein subunit 15